MKILAIDSTCPIAAVCVTQGDRLITEYTLNSENTHSETLLPMIESMLNAAGIRPDDIEMFAAAAGPGSFTGVRIGVATLKGLAFGRNVPCVCVSTLEGLARNLAVCGGIICPVMNARRNQVYTAVFRCEDHKLTRLMKDSVIRITELDEYLLQFKEKIYFCGDGYSLIISSKMKIKPEETPERLRHNSAFSVALAAFEKFNAGEYTTDENLSVNYLRPSQAERELNEKISGENL